MHQAIDGGKKQLVNESNKLLLNRNINSGKAAGVWLTAAWGCRHFSCALPQQHQSVAPRQSRRSILAQKSTVWAPGHWPQLEKQTCALNKMRGSFLSCKLVNFYPEPMWRYLDLFHMSDLARPWFDVCRWDSSLLKYIRGGETSRLCVQKVQKHPQKKIILACENTRAKGDSVINQYPTAAY